MTFRDYEAERKLFIRRVLVAFEIREGAYDPVSGVGNERAEARRRWKGLGHGFA